jgi:hypothetical protein
MNRPTQHPNRKQDLMAGRTLNRRDLRRQAEAAEQLEQQSAPAGEPAAIEPAAKKPRKAAAARKPSARKPRAARADARMRVRWCIYDGGMKQIAMFDYNQRAAAEVRLAELQARSKVVHFLRLFKDAIPQPAAPAGD